MAKQPNLDLKKLEVAKETIRAITHPLRITIVQMLLKNEKMSVTQIYEELKIEQPTASHHLSILKDKNILDAKRTGRMICYSVKANILEKVLKCIDQCNEAIVD